MRNENHKSPTGIERLGLRNTERTTTSSTGIARLGLRDTERTTTTGKKMDHFDSEITCEEFYDDNEGWDENDGQPDEYTEWQDLYEGDDWDHGQYDYF